MQTFKSYLAEDIELLIEGSTSASTLVEGVLVDCWNMSQKYNVRLKWDKAPQQKFMEEILNLPDTSSFLKVSKSKKEWATTGKTPEQQAELLWGLCQLCKQKIRGVSGNADGAGSTKKTLSNKWNEITGKSVDTSKADIIIGNTGISVKAPSENIMSCKQLEGKATVIAAMEKVGGSGKLKDELLGYLDKFVTEANTEGAEWSGRNLKNADPKDVKLEHNKKIREALINAEGEFKKSCESAFTNAFRQGNIGNAFAYEAMTGEEKFAGRVFGDVGDETGEATHMLIWDYDLKKLKFYKAKEKVRDVAKGLKMEATLKSSRREKKIEGKKVKVGYSIYQSMRLAINTSLEDADKLTDDVKEEIQKMENMLSEGIINEFSFKEKLGKLWSSVKDKLKGIWNWLKEQLNKIKEIFNEMWDEGLDSVLSYFETYVKIKVNQTIRL